MGSAILRILSIDKGKIGLSVARGVEKGKFEMSFRGNGAAHRAGLLYLLIKKIEKPIFRADLFAIKNKSQARIEIGIVPEPFEDQFFLKGKFFKDLSIGDKFDIGAVCLLLSSLLFVFQNALCKSGLRQIPHRERFLRENGKRGH